MKKTIALILTVIMIIITLPSFPISASAWTPISNAEEFMAMAPSGSYYLTSDITLSATYEPAFEGALNGNGKTLTVSAPIFSDFSGKVENLTINGEIKLSDRDAAAFTVTSAKGFESVNCINNASVIVSGNAKYAAAFVGTCYAPVKFTNCVNNGNISIDSSADEKPRAGGFGAVIDTLAMNGCINNGNIYLKGNKGIAGGLVARVAFNPAKNYLEIYNSTNNGNVTVEDTYIAKDGTEGTGASDAGGIVGYIGTSKNIGTYKVWGCTNNGNIDAPYRVGGFVGYCYASGYDTYIDMQFCINTGNVTYGRTKAKAGAIYYDYASGLVAYTNSPGTTIKYSVDTGKVTLRDGAVTSNKMIFVGASSANIFDYDLAGIYIVNIDIDPSTYIPEMPPASSTIYREPVFGDKLHKITLADIASGKVAYEINLAAEEDTYGDSAYKAGFAFYQKIGEDSLPSVDSSRGWVVLDGNTYANGTRETEPPETTEAPAETTQSPKTEVPALTDEPTSVPPIDGPPKTGCGGMVAGSVAIIVLLGTTLVIKKRD